jgi:uncharacterized membrane protein YhaH (DUF805 family)
LETKRTVSKDGNLSFFDSRLTPKSVDFAGAVKEAFSKYVTFKGRASRSEYWYFVLFYVSLFLILILGAFDTGGVIGFIGLLAILASIIPFYSVTARRLHDTGKSGWWYWVSLIPFGGFVVIYFLTEEGESRDNVYGPAQLS